MALDRNGIYFTWVAVCYKAEARGLWINASLRERPQVKFHLSEFRIWKEFSSWGNRGSVACQLLWMKTSATYSQPQVDSQHLDGTWTRVPSPMATAILVWYGEQRRGITPLPGSGGEPRTYPVTKLVTWPLGPRELSLYNNLLGTKHHRAIFSYMIWGPISCWFMLINIF